MASSDFDLRGKTALVTGGGGGLGRAIAGRLAPAGASVVVVDIDTPACADVSRELSASGLICLAAAGDVADEASVDSAVSAAEEAFGGVDILVNNAAVYPRRPWCEISREEWDHVFSVNVRGAFLLCRRVHPHMRASRWGRIVNISSIVFYLGSPELAHYVSTKGALIGFTRSLARELGPEGITVNAVAPGAFPTAAETIQGNPASYSQFVLEHQAIKRRGDPEDVAWAVLFLASPMSGFITGQCLVVDGGWAME